MVLVLIRKSEPELSVRKKETQLTFAAVASLLLLTFITSAAAAPPLPQAPPPPSIIIIISCDPAALNDPSLPERLMVIVIRAAVAAQTGPRFQWLVLKRWTNKVLLGGPEPPDTGPTRTEQNQDTIKII